MTRQCGGKIRTLIEKWAIISEYVNDNSTIFLPFRYNYDLNGNLHLLNPGNSGRLTPLRYDLRDRITRLGDVQYRLDEDGFLRQRGAEIFEYNSKGQSYYFELSAMLSPIRFICMISAPSLSISCLKAI